MPPTPEQPHPERTFLVADIGGTNIKLGLADSRGRLLAQSRFPTRAERGAEAILRELIAALDALRAQAPAGEVPVALGLGSPGLLLPDQGLLVQAPNLPGWEGLPLARLLSEALGGLPTRLENDANLYALGEGLAGAARGLSNFLGITLGTGVGGGLILSGRLWQGAFGTAAEFGHVPVDKNGQRCGCGARGCLETLASASAMARQARAWLKEGHASAYRGVPDDLTSEDLFSLAKQADPLAREVFAQAGEALGLALTGVLNLLGLEGVIFGGGGAGALEFLKPSLMRVIKERAFVVKPEQLRLRAGELGEQAPLVGAAALMIEAGY